MLFGAFLFLWALPELPAQVRTLSLECQPGNSVELVWIDAGVFERVDATPARIHITRGFYLGRYEITQQQFEAVMGSNPSAFEGRNRPVEKVTWDEAETFCRKLSERTGHTVRLPTEAEWEYAARANRPPDRLDTSIETAWFQPNSERMTQPVGGRAANPWGLHDMQGNVWEWCADACDWGANSSVVVDLEPSRGIDPVGTRGALRVIRGGGWGSSYLQCLPTRRDAQRPDTRYEDLGFRILVADGPAPPVTAAAPKSAALRFGFIDAGPNGPGKEPKDSTNFFLRPGGTVPALDFYYQLQPEGETIEDVRLHVFSGTQDKPLLTLGGEKAGDAFATGPLLHRSWTPPALWPDEAEGFFRVQLEVQYRDAAGSHTVRTAIADGDPDTPGWQCPPDGLAVHDLVWKHRPIIHLHPDEIGSPAPIREFVFGSGNHTKEWLDPDGHPVDHPVPTLENNHRSFLGLFDDNKPTIGPLNQFSQAQLEVLTTDPEAETVYHSAVAPGQPGGADNFAFLQYWFFMHFSRRPFNIAGLPFDPNVQHEADLEHCQIAVRLRDPDQPDNKARWLTPFAATASQHYYAQTLKWVAGGGQPAPDAHSQEEVEHQGDRLVVYIGLGSHATYFAADDDIEVPDFKFYLGTQQQYDPTPESALDRTAAGPRTYTLTPLTGYFAEFKGRWGFYYPRLPGSFRNGPPGPLLRTAKVSAHKTLTLIDHPAELHNRARKRSQWKEMYIPGIGQPRFQTTARAAPGALPGPPPQTPEAWLQLAVDAGDPDTAIRYLDRAIEQEPEWAEAYHQRALAYRALDDLVRARADYDKALALQPRYAEALHGRSAVRRSRGDTSGAEDDLERSRAVFRDREDFRMQQAASRVRSQPQDAEAVWNLAVGHYYTRKDYPAAVEEFRQYLTLVPAPANDHAYRLLAQALEKTGRMQEADAVYRESLQRFPSSDATRLKHAELLEAMGDADRAEAERNRVRETQRSRRARYRDL